MKQDKPQYKDIFRKELRQFFKTFSGGNEDLTDRFIEYLDTRMQSRIKTGNAIIKEDSDNVDFGLNRHGADFLFIASAIVEYVMYSIDTDSRYQKPITKSSSTP